MDIKPKLEDLSIHAFIVNNEIKTETGAHLDFKNHLFLFEPYRDLSPKQVILKAAQIGFSTLAILKSFWVAKTRGMDIIYTLPTQDDVQIFAGGKINRLIMQNPVLQGWVKEKDRVEQKAVGDNIIYYRGTWNAKQAISHASDLNIYDEVDSSKQEIIEQYATRLQHSPYKWEWFFSHPSTSGTGVDRYWNLSDQKHWFIACSGCSKKQFLSWPESIDMERGVFVCKHCGGEIRNEDRRRGEWVRKFRDREYSGYWIPLLICPWVSARDIIGYFKTKPEDYFFTKVLGLPFIGKGNKLTQGHLFANLTNEILTPDVSERVVIGIDTGLKLDYVVGGSRGLFYHGEAQDYEELDKLMKRWPRAIAIIDAGGDLIGSRAFQARWSGRVFLCFLRGDKQTEELVKWGSKDEHGAVQADRNRLIQLVVDEFIDQRIPLQGTENDWHEYYTDWNNLYRIKVIDPITGAFKGFKWVRSGRDHRALATVFWRVGMMRFGGTGSIYTPKTEFETQKGYDVLPNNTVKTDLTKLFKPDEQPEDWRQ